MVDYIVGLYFQTWGQQPVDNEVFQFLSSY